MREMCLRDIWIPDLYSPLCYAYTTLYLSIYVFTSSPTRSLSLLLTLLNLLYLPKSYLSPTALFSLSLPSLLPRLFSLSPGDALGMKVVVGSADKIDLSSGDYCGVMVQVAPQHPLS